VNSIKNKITNIQFGILILLAVVLGLIIVLLPVQAWSWGVDDKGMILEMLVASLLAVQIVSLFFQIKDHEEK